MSSAVSGLVLIGIIGAAIILIGGLLGFARWLLARAVSGAVWSVHATLWLLAAGSRRLALTLQVVTAWVAVQLWKACAAILRSLLGLIGKGYADLAEGVREGWQKQRAQPDGEDARPPPEAEGEDAFAESDEAGVGKDSAYDAALELLGLTGVRPLTSALLRQRYGQLIKLVHPDTGFPNRVFAQQLNAAVLTIKKAHGWR